MRGFWSASAVVVLCFLAGDARAQQARPARNQAPRLASDFPRGAELRVGDTLEFSVSASDFEGDGLALELLNPPPGMSFSPVKGATGPVTRRARWTIHDTDRSGRLVFEARDDGTPVRRARLTLNYRVFGVRGRGLVLEDVTGDGGLDVLALSARYRAGRGAFALWSDTGTPLGVPTSLLEPGLNTLGSFGRVNDCAGSLPRYDHALVDLTGDGVRDLVVGAYDTCSLFVYEGGVALDGSPAQRARLLLPCGGNSKLELDERGFADLDGDGATDLVAAMPSYGGLAFNGGAVFLWQGGASLTGTPAYQARLVSPLAGANAFLGRGGVRIGDVTGDGELDIVSGAQLTIGPDLRQAVLVWAGPVFVGDVAPSATLYDTSGSIPADLVLRDLDADGVLDLLTYDATRKLRVWSGGPTLGSTPAPDATLEAPLEAEGLDETPVFRDVTGDGVLDLVVWNRVADAGATNTGALYVWKLGSALSGTVAPSARLSVPGAVAGDQLGTLGVQFGDVTGDGQTDLVVGAPFADVAGVVDAGVVHVFRGGAGLTGEVAPHALLRRAAPGLTDELGRLGTDSGGVQLADVSGDGVLDVVAGGRNIDVGALSNAGALEVWLGGSELSGSEEPGATLTASDARAGDLMGGTGTNAYSCSLPGTVGPLDALSLRFADVTGDGILDVVAGAHVADGPAFVADTGAVYVWAGGASLSGAVPASAALRHSAASASDRLGVAGGLGIQFADLSGDGVLDLVVGNSLANPAGVNDAGAVRVYLGGASLTGLLEPAATLTASDKKAGDQLGTCGVNTVGGEWRDGQGLVPADIDGDGQLDLVVLASEANPDGVADAGAIYLWLGPITGSRTEDRRLAPGLKSSGDRLGF